MKTADQYFDFYQAVTILVSCDNFSTYLFILAGGYARVGLF